MLAAVFAFGAPIVVSTFHLYMLDVPQASLVAACVWLLLASRRFQRPGVAAPAGLAAAGAMLLKPTTVTFLAGPLLVIQRDTTVPLESYDFICPESTRR